MLTLLLVLHIQMSMRTWQNNNPIAVVVLAAAAAAVLVLAGASDCRAAASAAAAAARHACCVCVSFFFVIHNADASSTDIDPYASGRSPQSSRICSGAYVATCYGRSLLPRRHHGALIMSSPVKSAAL